MVLVITRNTSLQTPSNVLLACQSFSDFLVGLLVQPSYGAFRLIEKNQSFCAMWLKNPLLGEFLDLLRRFVLNIECHQL